MAARLAACFPRFRPQALTLEAWAEEFLLLDPIIGEAVLERLKEQLDGPPSVKELIGAIKTIRNAEERAKSHAQALAWQTTKGEQPTTFAEWAKTNPEGAAKLMRAVPGSEVAAKLIAMTEAGEIGEAAETTWNPHDPPCENCHRPVANGPNAQSRYDGITDTWVNAHVECPGVVVQETLA